MSEFYRDQFKLVEVESMRSDIFRAYKSGDVVLGFSALSAYELLDLERRKSTDGDQTALTFELSSRSEVDSFVGSAEANGAALVKAPFVTYYNWYMAVLRDPDGNAIRLTCTTK